MFKLISQCNSNLCLNKFENWYKNEMKMFFFLVDLLRFIEKAIETNN